MARPKSFDRDDALQAGVEAFWRQGYAATTTDDLARATGVWLINSVRGWMPATLVV